MRTIKFRGKRVNNSEWVYGNLLLDRETGCYICEGIGSSATEVKPESVGQFTGLHDKNGKEIYEGDILNFGNNNHVEVKFENGAFTVFSEPLGWDFDSDDTPILTDFKYCEIIGNIHENPSLINP